MTEREDLVVSTSEFPELTALVMNACLSYCQAVVKAEDNETTAAQHRDILRKQGIMINAAQTLRHAVIEKRKQVST